MTHVLERAAPEAIDKIEATLNYIENDGSKIFTVTGGPGGTDVRSGGTPDPHRVTDPQRPAARQGLRRSSATASASCATTPRSPTSSTRTRSSASITRRWKR